MRWTLFFFSFLVDILLGIFMFVDILSELVVDYV